MTLLSRRDRAELIRATHFPQPTSANNAIHQISTIYIFLIDIESDRIYIYR